VEYYSLVFDRHEIVYAEGVATESLLVNPATLPRLPEALMAELRVQLPGLDQRPHFGTDAGPAQLDAIGRGRLLAGPDGG
jgi:hypothetical protein